MTDLPAAKHPGDLLSAYLDAMLSAPDRVSVEEHLAECGPCRDWLDAETQLRQALRALPTVDPPVAFYEQLLQRGPWDRRAKERRLRFGIANLAASAAVWFAVIVVGQLRGPTSTHAVVSSFAAARQASVAPTGAGLDATTLQSMAKRSGLPSAASRFQLVDIRDTGDLRQAVYSDGRDVVNLFRQRGRLDETQLEVDAKHVTVSGRAAVLIERDEVQVLLFQRGDFVYAIEAPATSGVVTSLVETLPAPPDPSILDRARDAGKGLLDAFGLAG